MKCAFVGKKGILILYCLSVNTHISGDHFLLHCWSVSLCVGRLSIISGASNFLTIVYQL